MSIYRDFLNTIPACKLLYTGTLFKIQCTCLLLAKYRDQLKQSVPVLKAMVFLQNMYLPVKSHIQGLFGHPVYLPVYCYVHRIFEIKVNLPIIGYLEGLLGKMCTCQNTHYIKGLF